MICFIKYRLPKIDKETTFKTIKCLHTAMNASASSLSDTNALIQGMLNSSGQIVVPDYMEK
jgi:hypothetical protein